MLARPRYEEPVLNTTNDWWQFRRDELLALSGQTSSLYVFNDETLNEIFFDLLSLESTDRLLYPVYANPHPKILRKGVEQGAGFICRSGDEMVGLLSDFPGLDPERIVFFPVVGTGRQVARAFNRGVHVAVGDPSIIKQWPDVFKNREIFTCGDMGLDQMEITVQGWYQALKGDCLSAPGPYEASSLLAGPLTYLPKGAILILGNGTEENMSNEWEGMGIPAWSQCLKIIAHSCPGFRLWLELPHAILARAGILITRVCEIGEEAGIRCVCVDAPVEALVSHGRGGISQGIVNLSRPPGDQPVLPAHIIGQARGPGKRTNLVGAPAVIEQGDVLAFTRMGTPGAGNPSEENPRNRISQHYLHARSMCRIKI